MMNTTLRKSTLCLVVAAAFAFPLAGCGSSDDNSSDDSSTDTSTNARSYGEPADTSSDDSSNSSGGSASNAGGTIALAADPNGAIAYDTTELTAKAGENTLDFENASQVPHAVEVEGNGIEEETETITGGKTSLKLDLKPGTYTFYCPVGDHAEEGMKGTLTVK